MDGTGLLFQPLIDALPSTIKPIVISYPGDQILRYDDLVELVIRTLPLDSPFVILGESFSGPIAVMIGARRPSGLVGIILCATFVTPPWRLIGPLIPLIARPLLFQTYIPFKYLRAWLGGFATSATLDLISEIGSRVRPRVMAARVRQVFTIDVRPEFERCEVSILDLRGVTDRAVPVRHRQLFRKMKSDLVTATVGRSHMLLQRFPKETADAIMLFINALDIPHIARDASA